MSKLAWTCGIWREMYYTVSKKIRGIFSKSIRWGSKDLNIKIPLYHHWNIVFWILWANQKDIFVTNVKNKPLKSVLGTKIGSHFLVPDLNHTTLVIRIAQLFFHGNLLKIKMSFVSYRPVRYWLIGVWKRGLCSLFFLDFYFIYCIKQRA